MVGLRVPEKIENKIIYMQHRANPANRWVKTSFSIDCILQGWVWSPKSSSYSTFQAKCA
jgi:hypothetical protein